MVLMKSPRRKSLILIAALLLMTSILSSCGGQDNTGKAPAVKKSDTVANSRRVADLGITLPVLDALFFEEGFEQDLKSKLQVTDEQITKLKTASRASVADLTEEGASDYLGSARGAAKRSDEHIRAILGDEKTAQLYKLVGQRYAAGDVEGLMPTTPNAVPTDTRIVVNAPAYRMDIFQDGKLLKTYRVGIGYPEFPLPTGMRRAETIIFNPTWTPPDEPWVKGKVQAGKTVAAGSRLNPLGPIKIPIGMPSLIHGGKAVAKLGTFASHGCVGLTNAQVQDFAISLAGLSGSPLTAEDVSKYEQQKKETKNVKLEKAVPVELRYETIVGEPGGLRIYRDVYEQGTNTLDGARRVLDVYGVKYESLAEGEKTALLQALTEMNHDARGVAIVENVGGAEGTTASGDTSQDADPVKSAKAKKGGTTKTIVGRKEVAVPIAAMQGKGYPAPVNLNTGSEAVAGTNPQ